MIKVVAGVAICSSLILASDLHKLAIDAGLKPIPLDKKELMKLIEQPNNKITKEKVTLGEKLYFDPRLSKSGLISCNTCHNLALGGTDGVSAAIGHSWTANPHHLNSPTVYNSAFNKTQFWDGRSPHLDDQAKGPMVAEPEMAITPELAVERVVSIPEYVEMFKKAFPKEEVTFDNIAKAIGAFEAGLVTPSKFDDFLNGNLKALNKKEQEGLKTFIDVGCASCHNGVGVGGASMQKFPLMGEYAHSNLGDFKGDKDGLVKVPTLRNITKTAPYMHNGAIWSLRDAVATMGDTQLGKKLEDKEIDNIMVFLSTLDGRMPKITYPILPASTDKTPQPIVK